MGDGKLSEISHLLFEAERACLVAPAGYGKTQTICEAVSLSNNGRQLILTHTHAGVQSLRNRLKKLSVKPSQYEIDTIDGWAFNLIRHYPKTSRFTKSTPQGSDWIEIRSHLATFLDQPFIKKVIQASYTGLFVDEYQDCTKKQHEIFLCIANMIPCRIVGDPLQGIFDFSDDPQVDWEKDVNSVFKTLPELNTPHRWLGKNPELGSWLADVRKQLLSKSQISLDVPFIKWNVVNLDNQLQGCIKGKMPNESTIAIYRNHTTECHQFARKLQGTYQSIETMEARDLIDHAGRFDSCSDSEFAQKFKDFATACIVDTVELEKLIQDFSTKDFKRILELFKYVSHSKTIKFYRAELWHEMKNAFISYNSGEFLTLKDAAWYSRSRTRLSGRKEYKHVVSRTLLIKGLEYDHAIVLDADQFTRKHLYVALTRGAKSLTIFSKTKSLNPTD